MTAYSDLCVIVPAYNEEAAICHVIEDLHTNLPGCNIIVVDDCSSDRTAELASHSSVRVLSLSFNQGYGAALRNGLEVSSGKWVAWFDSDGEHRAVDLKAMVDLLIAKKQAAILGERSGSVSGTRSFGKFLIRIFAVLLGLGYVADFNCGLRVFQRDVIFRFLVLLPTGYSASTTSTFLVIRSHLPFEFYKINLRKRVGQSKVRLQDGLRTFITVLRIASLMHPLRLFGSLALIFAVVGTVYSGITMLANEQGVPVLGAFLMISAVLLFGIAIIADQLSLFRIQHSMVTGQSKLNAYKNDDGTRNDTE